MLNSLFPTVSGVRWRLPTTDTRVPGSRDHGSRERDALIGLCGMVDDFLLLGIFFIEGERCPRPSSDPNMRVIPSLHGTHEADTVNRSLGSRSRGTTSSLYSPSCLSRRNLLQVRTPTPARTMVRIMVPETVLTTRRMLPDS